MVHIKLIQIGHNTLINLNGIVAHRNKSSVFRFDTNILVNLSPVFLNKPELTIHDSELSTLTISDTASFNVGVINRPLDGNFFSRPINNKFIVVSTYDFDSLEIHEGITTENYFLRFAYAFSLIFEAYNGLKEEAKEIMQDNISGCLFDRAIYKRDIATFFNNPHISISAKNVLNSKTLDQSLIDNVETEIKKLKISWYYKYSDWLKKHPIAATVLISFAALIFKGLVVNALYDWIKDLCKQTTN